MEGNKLPVDLGTPFSSRTAIEISEEVARAKAAYPTVHSHHHGLSIIQEEVYELMLEVYKKPKDRDKDALRREAVQIAATAIRFIEELT